MVTPRGSNRNPKWHQKNQEIDDLKEELVKDLKKEKDSQKAKIASQDYQLKVYKKIDNEIEKLISQDVKNPALEMAMAGSSGSILNLVLMSEPYFRV